MEATLAPPQPASALMTAEELARLSPDIRCELIDGVLIEMSPTSARHGMAESRFDRKIGAYLDANPIGELLVGEPGFILRRNPDRVRAPDVAFVRSENAPKLPDQGFIPIAADLVVEVVSPDDAFSEVLAKVEEWLAFGVSLVWVADPGRQKIHVYHAGGTEVLQETDILSGGEVLPGFAVPVGEFFP